MLQSKIHRAVITDVDPDYEGSISIDQNLCDKARLLPFQKVDIYNCSNGARFSTYVIPGKADQIGINGAASRLVQKGDIVIIAAYVEVEDALCPTFKPNIVLVDHHNRPK